MNSYTQYMDTFWNLSDNYRYRPYPYYEYRGVSQKHGNIINTIPVDAVRQYDRS